MSEQELLQAMSAAFGDADGDRTESMRAVLDVLHANGYRRCAEGQGMTQSCLLAEDANAAQRAAENDLAKYIAWCAMAEAEVEWLRANIRAVEDDHIAYSDHVGDVLGQGEDEPLLTRARQVMSELSVARQQIERLRAERDALRADAERYRWLRSEMDADIAVVQGFGAVDSDSTGVAATYEEALFLDKLDAAIDAARESKP